jgi:hypothetical protein
MAQRENNYERENKFDRQKTSKFEVGDLVEANFKRSKNHKDLYEPTRFVIYEKRQAEDKQGFYWVYSVFYPHSNHILTDITLCDTRNFTYVKLA